MKRILWLTLALLTAVAIPMLLGGSDMLERVRTFPLPLLMGMLGLILLCWCLNALRLHLLLAGQAAEMGRFKTLGVVVATEFAICATPGGSGGPLTLMALLSRNGVRPAKSSAVFAMDQLNDLVFFFCALIGILFYALFHTLNRYVEKMLLPSALVMLAGLVGCVLLVRFHRQAIRLNGRLLARLHVNRATRIRWARRLLHFLEAFSDTFKLPRKILLLVFGLTCLHWGLRYSVLYLALHGLGAQLQWAWSFLIQILSLSAGQFSLLPGGAGAAELTSAALLAPLVGKSTAAAAILIWRAVTYYFYLIVGGPVFLALIGKPLLHKLMRLKQA